MKPQHVIIEASHAMSADRLDNLARRAKLTPMSGDDRAAVERAIAVRRAHLASPEWLQKLVRTL